MIGYFCSSTYFLTIYIYGYRRGIEGFGQCSGTGSEERPGYIEHGKRHNYQ
jgi:hypothetical protein